MRKYLCIILFVLFVSSCGDSNNEDNNIPGGECCKNHGGHAVCMHDLVLNSHGKFAWSDHGQIVCNDKDAKGNNYVCPGSQCD